MIGEQQPLLPIDVRIDLLQALPQQPLLEQLFLQPERDRQPERTEAARRERQIGLEQPLELDERLFVEHHVVEIGRFHAGLIEAIADRGRRKPRVVLDAGEALLLRGGDDAAVDDQRRGAVVIEGRNAEDARRHQNSV